MLHPICFLPTLYTDTDMSIFGMVIVLAFQICILLMGFTASFSSEPQLYESWHEFPIDLLYKDVSSLDTKWRHWQKFEDPPCPNSQYIGTLLLTSEKRNTHARTGNFKSVKFDFLNVNKAKSEIDLP